MGAIIGRQEFIRNDEIEGQGKQVLAMAKKLKLTNVELDRIFHEFVKHQNIATHTVNIEKMFASFRHPYTVYDRFVFQMFDRNKTGELVFYEYMLIMWGILSTDEDGLAALVFSMFDTERTSTLDVREVKYLIHCIWSFKLSPQAEKAMNKLEWNEDGVVTVAEFVLLSRHFSILLQPIRQTKARLRKYTVHTRFWREVGDKRLNNFQLLTMFDLTDRTDKSWFVMAMDYLSLQPEVPVHFVEQYNFVVRKRQNSKKGDIAVPQDELLLSGGPRTFSEKKKKKGVLW